MPKKEGTTPEVVTPEVQQPEGEVAVEKTYTQAEVDVFLKDKVGLEREVSKKGEEIRRLEQTQGNWKEEIQALRDEQKMLFALTMEGKAPEELDNATPQEKGAYLKRIEEMQAEAKAKRLGEQYKKRTETLGLTPKDKDYRDIYRDFQAGNFEFVEAQLTELEAARVKQTETPETPQKTVDELVAERLGEEKRKWAEEQGWLTTDAGGPSSSSNTFADIEARFNRGEITWEKYREARQKEGIF